MYGIYNLSDVLARDFQYGCPDCREKSCGNCACCKERRRCVSCLPGRLGRCENYGVTSSSDESVFEKDSEDEPGTDDASEASDVAPSSGGECSPSFDANNSQGFDAVPLLSLLR